MFKNKMCKIVDIVICYNNSDEVKKYAEHLSGLVLSELLTLIIVVNAARKEDLAVLAHIRESVSYEVLISKPRHNLGYMKGLIHGYQVYRHKYREIPCYVIMGNTDIEIPDPDFLKTLLATDYENDIWCIGPSVYTKYTGNYDNPVALKRRSKAEIDSLILRFSIPVFRTLYVWLSMLKPMVVKRKRGKSQKVYEVHGCFFILTGECAECLTDHKYTPLMYSEETYIAEIIYENGKSEYYDAELKVIHEEHTSTRLLGNRKIAKYLSESMRYIRREFY